jgi:hypothetical protein
MLFGQQVLLVTPPLLPNNEFPELGAPQIAGYLTDHGVECRQRDLNAEFLFRWLGRSAWLDKIKDSVGGDAARLGSARMAEGGIEGVRRWVGNCSRVLNLDSRSYERAAMELAVSRGHPVYDSFFAESLFGAESAAPQVLGLSVMSSSQLLPAMLLAKQAHACWPGTFVVMGGPWVSASRDNLETVMASFPMIDGLVVDRGEIAMLGLARALGREAELSRVPNLVLRRGASVVRTPDATAPLLDELGAPNFDGLDLDMLPVRMLPVQTTSRCYWGQCTFCYHDVRSIAPDARRAARIASDVELLRQRYGTNSFFLADCATPIETMSELAELLSARESGVRWSALARADARYSPELCAKLYRGGCRVLLFGLETVSRRGLSLLRKGITPEMVAHTVRCCGDAGLGAYLFLLDFPGNTVEEFRATLEFVVSLAPWVEDFIVSRFQLSEVVTSNGRPELFDVRRTVDATQWLEPFDIPYETRSMMPRAQYQGLVDEHTARFFAVRAKPRRDPFVLGTSE